MDTLTDELTLLRQRVADLDDFIEHGAMPLHWVDPNGIITWANKAELEMLGYTSDEYIGQSITRFHADQDVIGDILKRLSADETITDYPARLICKNGSIKQVLINSNVKRENGEFIHTRCFTRDISAAFLEEKRITGIMKDLKQAEAQSAMLAAIVDSSDDAIISKTFDSIVTSWNDSAERLFGYTAEEMIGESILKLIPPDRREEEPLIIGRLKRGERVQHFETIRMTKAGTLLEVSLTISPIRDKQGNITGVSKIARDITEKKREDARKNDFIAMVSHELKTPLTSMKSYLQVLLGIAKKEGSAFQINALGRAEIQAQKMTVMIHDFLNLARLEDGKIGLNKTLFDLHPLIEEVSSDAPFLTSNHQVNMIDCEKIKLVADRDKLGQVLNNLLSNAIKYSPKGGMITIGCEKHDKQVKIFVRDEGVGISTDDQKRLFERFYRSKDEKIKTVSGFGIGLYLVSEILRYHGSRIEVDSTTGKGSTFYFMMDCAS